jgi:hypothetical protein
MQRTAEEWEREQRKRPGRWRRGVLVGSGLKRGLLLTLSPLASSFLSATCLFEALSWSSSAALIRRFSLIHQGKLSGSPYLCSSSPKRDADQRRKGRKSSSSHAAESSELLCAVKS